MLHVHMARPRKYVRASPHADFGSPHADLGALYKSETDCLQVQSKHFTLGLLPL